MNFKVFCKNINGSYLQPGKSDLEVYYGITDKLEIKVPFFFSLLSDGEKARATRFKHVSDYNCYVSVHALLRIELSKLLRTDPRSIVIREFKNGKPFMPEVDLPFSLSRSKNMFTFVIGRSDQSIGIDIEHIKPFIDFVSISKNYFGIKEQQLILSFDNIEDQYRTFFEIWTRKEAFLKTIGIGISTDLGKVNVLEGENQIEIDGVSALSATYKISTINHNKVIFSISSSTDFIPRLKELS